MGNTLQSGLKLRAHVTYICRSMGDIKPPGPQFWVTRSLGAENQKNVRDLAESLNKVGVLSDADLVYFRGQTVDEEEVRRALGTIDNAIRQSRRAEQPWYLGSLERILTYFKETCPPNSEDFQRLQKGIQELVKVGRETESPLDRMTRKRAEAAEQDAKNAELVKK